MLGFIYEEKSLTFDPVSKQKKVISFILKVSLLHNQIKGRHGTSYFPSRFFFLLSFWLFFILIKSEKMRWL